MKADLPFARLVVGAGFTGSIVARELADAGFMVRIIDRRRHIAGNAYDEADSAGVTIHRYGPHIFHTNSERVFRYLSQSDAHEALYLRYAALAEQEPNVTFVGRLAQYRYNMD